LQYDAWQTGYWMMLAPLAPGPHTIHHSIEIHESEPGFHYEATYNLTVVDTSSLIDGGPRVDVPSAPDSGEPID
jgi:hypothetical protein